MTSMNIFSSPARKALNSVSAIVLASLLAWPCLLHGAEAEAEQKITAEQQSEIESAKTVDDLLEIGKQFFYKRHHAAAAASIERACNMKPNLLTSDEKLSPRSWNAFWYETVSELREAQLKEDDATGYAALAEWVLKADLVVRARDLTETALSIDETLPEAQRLALLVQPKCQVDFRYALQNAVIVEQWRDESVQLTPRPRSKLLVVPFSYIVTGERYALSSSSVDVETETGRRCRTLGLMVSKSSQPRRIVQPNIGHDDRDDDEEDDDERESGRDRDDDDEEDGEPDEGGENEADHNAAREDQTGATIRMVPRPQEPPKNFDQRFYERLIIEISDGEPVVTWMNTMISRKQGDTGPPSRPPLDKRRGSEPASGWAGAVISYPEDAQSVSIQILDGDIETIDLALLETVQSSSSRYSYRPSNTEDDAGQSLTSQVQLVAKHIADGSPAAAQVAVEWLGQVASSHRQSTGDASNGATAAIEKAILTGLAHASERVRKSALTSLTSISQPLSDSSLAFIANHPKQAVVSNILTAAKAILEKAEVQPSNMAQQSFRQTRGQDISANLDAAVASLPKSKAPENIYRVLSACLNCNFPAMRQRTLRILMSDGTQQSAKILLELPEEAQQSFITSLGDAAKDEFKAAVIRVMLLRSESASLGAVLQACQGIKLTITSSYDPIIESLSKDLPPDTLSQLLRLLSRADFSQMHDDTQLANTLKSLATKYQNNSKVRSALLAFAAGQFDRPYDPPLRLSIPSAKRQPKTSELEKLLSKLAMDDKVDLQTAINAATTIVKSGRVLPLAEAFKLSKESDRPIEVLRALCQDFSLRKRGSLYTLLASGMSSQQDKLSQFCIATLSLFIKHATDDEAWQIRHAVKQGIKPREFSALTTRDDRRISEMAMNLLINVANLSRAEAQDLTAISGEQQRFARLEMTLREKVKDMVGDFNCMVYVEIEQFPPQPTGATRQADTNKIVETLPLPAGVATLAEPGDGQTRGKVGDRTIPTVESKSGGGRPASSTTLAVTPIVACALRQESLAAAGVKTQIDLSPLTGGRPLHCVMHLSDFASWQGEVNIIHSANSQAGQSLARITSVKVILEPAITAGADR